MIHKIAIRIDVLTENTLKTFCEIILDGATSHIITQEVAKITKKKHYHAYATFENNIKYKTLYNRILKKIKTNYPKIFPHQFCTQKVESIDKYLLYITKDENVVSTLGFEEEILKNLLKKTAQINAEKKTKMKTQLVEHIFSQEEIPDYRDIMKLIINYHVSRDYLPPTPTLLFQYTVYVMVKLNYDTRELYMAKLNI